MQALRENDNSLAMANDFVRMTILAAFSDLDPLLQALGVLTALAIVALLGFKGWRYAVKRRNRGKIWLMF
jgi:hypothetical protein